MKNKVLVIGSGARELCIAWKLSLSSDVQQIYVYPGNAGCIFKASEKISIPTNLSCIENFVELAQWCISLEINLVIVGPEVPLVNGVADALEQYGVPCFGPRSSAAMIEGSKFYSKDFMSRHSIPTARYECFQDLESACNHVYTAPYRATVIKASGLAAGKGVVVAENQEKACLAVNQMLKEKRFGEAGSKIVIEEHLEGEEVSVLCFTDGENVAVMPSAQDHKRLCEGDTGPNTGGMGAYCPCPQVSEETLGFIKEEILQKTVDGLKEEGRKYVGVLYAGIMLTVDGPKVLEFNCRFGDPECQVILPLLKSDLYKVMRSCVNGTLIPNNLEWHSDTSAVGVVIASSGYPGAYEKDKVITGISPAQEYENVFMFHAGTKCNKSGNVVTSGGRVLTVVALNNSLKTAVNSALRSVKLIQFHGAYFRSDIAHRGINYIKRRRLTYAASGVNIATGNEFVKRISCLTKLTNRPGCASSIGGFGGIFVPEAAGYTHPVLVAGCDGVGTKLMLANTFSCHTTVGIDLVAMCVNDILTHNAEPLFFLDYYACGKLSLDVARDVVKGIADGCAAAGCALIGGETAEMPGMYHDGTYDLGGFAIGAYEKNRDLHLPRIETIKAGDIIIGVASTGLHSNGFSLVRKILNQSSISLSAPSPFDQSQSLGECLLKPTAIYSKDFLPILRKNRSIKGVVHVTGGGLLENIPRVLPKQFGARLDASCWTCLPIFGWIHQEGDLDVDEMLRTFNCGLGLCLIVDASCSDDLLEQCRELRWNISKVGHILPCDDGRRVIVDNIKEALIRSYVKNERKIGLNMQLALNNECRMLKKRIAVLISGSGTNLQALIDESLNNLSCPYQVQLVISNKAVAFGLARAKTHGIATKVISNKSYKDRESFDRAIHDELNKNKIDLVCLAGFMRLLSGWFVNQWRGKVLNIHPSLLPLFKGLDPHKQALDAGVRLSGCSVHFVVEEMDAGAIIGQESVPIYPGDTIETLQDRIKKAEHKLYPRALSSVCIGEALLSDAGNKILWKSCNI